MQDSDAMIQPPIVFVALAKIVESATTAMNVKQVARNSAFGRQPRIESAKTGTHLEVA